jgi:hypothetical protein
MMAYNYFYLMDSQQLQNWNILKSKVIKEKKKRE